MYVVYVLPIQLLGCHSCNKRLSCLDYYSSIKEARTWQHRCELVSSNFKSGLSKLLERLVVRQLMRYLSSSDLLPSLQSGFRPDHSVETALLRVLSLSDLLNAVDRGDVAALILLDMSVFVDHLILLQRLQSTFGIHDAVHQWF